MRRLALLSPVVLASFLVVCAIVLGGGGTPNPITEILLELTKEEKKKDDK